MQMSMERGYAIFADGKLVGFGANKREAEQKMSDYRNIAEHEAEPKECPDKSGRIAPEGKHWVLNIMSRTWVLESCGTRYTSSVQSETYWSS